MTDTITIPLATVQQALVTLEDVNPSLVCEMAHHPKKDQHGIGQKCPLEIRHLETIAAIKEVLAQPPLPVQEQQQARVDVITVNLMREGIDKHRARELADHFVNFTLTPPLLVQEPVAWLYPEGLEALQAGKCWTAYPRSHEDCNIPLYIATPPQREWVGLTEFQFAEIYNKWNDSNGSTPWGLYHAIEKALKAKNHG